MIKHLLDRGPLMFIFREPRLYETYCLSTYLALLKKFNRVGSLNLFLNLLERLPVVRQFAAE